MLSLRFLLFMKVLVPKPIWTQAVVNRKILAAVLVDIGFRKLRTRAPFVKCQAKSNPRFYQKDNNENLSSKNCQCCPMLGNTSHKKNFSFGHCPNGGRALPDFFCPCPTIYFLVNKMAYFFQITNDWNQALISMIGNLIQGSWRPNKVVQLARCSLNVFACVFVFVFLSLSSNDTVNADIYNAATMMAVVIDFPATCETCDMLPLPYIWQRSQLWKLYLLMLFLLWIILRQKNVTIFIVGHILDAMVS